VSLTSGLCFVCALSSTLIQLNNVWFNSEEKAAPLCCLSLSSSCA